MTREKAATTKRIFERPNKLGRIKLRHTSAQSNGCLSPRIRRSLGKWTRESRTSSAESVRGWGALPGISGFESRDELIRDGWITLMDGRTAAENFTQFLRAHPRVREIQSQAIFPGEPARADWARLEAYVNEVVEPVRRRMATIEEGKKKETEALETNGLECN